MVIWAHVRARVTCAASSQPPLQTRTCGRDCLTRALTAVTTTLRAWRARDRERNELAAMNQHDWHDMPFAREHDIRSQIAKPFWRA